MIELAHRACGDGHWLNAVVGIGIGVAGVLALVWFAKRVGG